MFAVCAFYEVVSFVTRISAELENVKAGPRRKGLELFQFKYYKEQQALNLSEDEIDCVVNAVLNPPELETRLIASKILIKVCIVLNVDSASFLFSLWICLSLRLNRFHQCLCMLSVRSSQV